eukprot:scaffold29809_cov34-Phaeocystis_antarctica.AAC.2
MEFLYLRGAVCALYILNVLCIIQPCYYSRLYTTNLGSLESADSAHSSPTSAVSRDASPFGATPTARGSSTASPPPSLPSPPSPLPLMPSPPAEREPEHRPLLLLLSKWLAAGRDLRRGLAAPARDEVSRNGCGSAGGSLSPGRGRVRVGLALSPGRRQGLRSAHQCTRRPPAIVDTATPSHSAATVWGCTPWQGA